MISTESAMPPSVSRIVQHLSDELPRRSKRKLSRAIRLAAGLEEYKCRKMLAGTVHRDECYAAVETLQRDGLSPIDPPRELLLPLIEAAKERARAVRPVRNKGAPNVYRLLESEDYCPTGPYVRFAVHEMLLRTVARYLGCVPFLNEMEVLLSCPSKEMPTKTQLWHRDLDDRRC